MDDVLLLYEDEQENNKDEIEVIQMKQKKEKSTVLVLFTIFILLVFIVLPPVFRTVFPKTISNEINQTTEKIDVLYYKLDDLEEGYNISIHVRYLNGKIKKNIKYLRENCGIIVFIFWS